MKNKITIMALTFLICIHGANAVYGADVSTCTTTTTSEPVGHVPSMAQPFLQYCSSISYINYYVLGQTNVTFSAPECTSCKRGYSKLTIYNNDNYTGANWSDSCRNNNPSLTICVKPCGDTCESDEGFDYNTNGVESLVERKCVFNGQACQTETYYQCASGYYGEAKSDYTGCTACPNPNEHYTVGSIPGEAKSITDCFIPVDSDNNRFNDGTGTYSCVSDAYYKQ